MPLVLRQHSGLIPVTSDLLHWLMSRRIYRVNCSHCAVSVQSIFILKLPERLSQRILSVGKRGLKVNVTIIQEGPLRPYIYSKGL